MDSNELERKAITCYGTVIRKRRIMTNETSMRNWSNLIMRCVMMILGALIYTVGLDLFLVPNGIIDGGVVGISLMAAELSGNFLL